MSTYQNPTPQQPQVVPHHDHGSLKFGILFGAVIALLAANVYMFLRIERLQEQVASGQTALAKEVAETRRVNTITSANQQDRIESLNAQLEAAKRQASLAVGQAKTEALDRVSQLNQKIADEQRRMTAEISEAKESASTAHQKIETVSTDVTNVKSEVATAKSEIDKTISDLKRMTGDMGVMSGLIATNSGELNALKALGERNYFEFNLAKTSNPQKVGDISLKLRKADQKRNRYTVEVYADDKKVEKKDKNINEPVQFYVAKARQPYELVVNEVQKDRIVGYLATPKVQVPRGSTN